MKRSRPGKAIRTGPTTGIRSDGAESPPLARGRTDAYGETVIRPLRRPPTVGAHELTDHPPDLNGFAAALARRIMEVVTQPPHAVRPEDAA